VHTNKEAGVSDAYIEVLRCYGGERMRVPIAGHGPATPLQGTDVRAYLFAYTQRPWDLERFKSRSRGPNCAAIRGHMTLGRMQLEAIPTIAQSGRATGHDIRHANERTWR
jgi:hypothetical protein